MGFLDRRTPKASPAQQRAIDAEVRRQVAMAVSIAKRKAEAEVAEVVVEVQAELLKAVQENAALKARAEIAELSIKPRT